MENKTKKTKEKAYIVPHPMYLGIVIISLFMPLALHDYTVNRIINNVE